MRNKQLRCKIYEWILTVAANAAWLNKIVKQLRAFLFPMNIVLGMYSDAFETPIEVETTHYDEGKNWCTHSLRF